MKLLKAKDIFRKSYEYCNLQYGDPDLLSSIIVKVNELATSAGWGFVEKYLDNTDDPLFLLNRAMVTSHCLAQKGFDLSRTDDLSKTDNLFNLWADSLSQLLLRIVQTTKEYDYLVQQILNYEDFLFYDMRITPERRKIACDIYDLRGVDFFLIHYMGGETTAYSDEALWKSAELIVGFLDESERQEEAIHITEELKIRRENLKEIITEYSSIGTQSISETIENIRLVGERFWVEYISSDVWINIEATSRRELLDAFVTEIMLKKGVLMGWSQVVLSLCKVIEREMGNVLFSKWVNLIQESQFSIPSDVSKRLRKRIQSREITFNTLKSCVVPPIHPPTLGQMVFISKFWNDEVMSKCTPLFTTINDKATSSCPNFVQKIEELTQFLEDTHPYNHEHPTLVDLRNASAHPGHEDDFTWNEHIPWLKELLGKPPREAFRVINELKAADSNIFA